MAKNKGYAMQMGSKEKDTPSAFNMQDAANIGASPMMSKEKEHPGFNFLPPKNPKPKKDLKKGALQPSLKKTHMGAHLGGKDVGSIIYDWDQDGDSIFRDYNQDGTMLGRGIKKAYNWWNKK
tara:strand:- start:146 stop:511 length:366 start_codon:yes stop_codon:yes gene_type:complete